MKIHQLSVDEALVSLGSRIDGLTPQEASRRLKEYGLNQVESLGHESLLLSFLKQFTHFFAFILWLAALLAFFAEYQKPGEGMSTIAWSILSVILINGLFSFWQEYRAEHSIAALQKLLPSQVKTLRGANLILLPTAELVPGDVVVLQEGDKVPADCRLLSSFSLRVNNATITGESLPQARDSLPSTTEQIIHSANVLVAGTNVVAGEGKAVVFSTGMHTEFGKIAHLAQISRKTLSPLQKEIAHLSRVIGGLALFLGLGFFFIANAIGLPFWVSFLFGIGFVVANVPEGLMPTVTMALAMASQRMAKRNALIRHLPSVEALGSTTVICTDKTGTLTQNIMKVKECWLGGQYFDANESAPTFQRYLNFFKTAMLCQNLKLTNDVWLGDPMEVALLQFAEVIVDPLPNYHKVDEIPFDTDRKRFSVIYDTPEGRTLYCKGAPETVVALCGSLQVSNEVVALDEEWLIRLKHAQNEMAAEGLRVLALASRVFKTTQQGEYEQKMILEGLVGISDPVRPEVPMAIQKCHDAGIKVIMVTGDHPNTALAIAREIGLVSSHHPKVITGDALHKLSNTQLQIALDAEEILFARVGADQKARIVTALKRKKHIVAVTGDGVNDAPALKAADIGISMGLSGTDIAKDAADMILLDDNFVSIVAAVEEGRAVFDNIRKFLVYILTSNIPEFVPYLAFALFKVPLALTIIQILAVDLGTDIIPALALGVEPPEHDVMRRPPRRREDRLLNWKLLVRAYSFLGLMEAVVAMTAFFYVLIKGGWGYGVVLQQDNSLYLQATTATFSAIILSQIFNVFLCRSAKRSIFADSFFSNHLMMAGVSVEFIVLFVINQTTWGHQIFGTLAIDWAVWLVILTCCMAMVLLEESRKWLLRKGLLFNAD